MANEKTWYMTNTLNVDCSAGSTDDAETGANWMYNLYTFLSGGAGQTTSPWLIISASNASSVTTEWTGSGDVTFNQHGSPHSWFVCKNNNIFPGSEVLYLTVACSSTSSAGNGVDFWMSFDHNEPNFTSSTTSVAPLTNSAGQAFHTQYKNPGDTNAFQRFRYPYSATSPTTYFHGTMDETTGSFVVFTGQSHSSLYGFPFSMAALRMETPRTSSLDPYPVLVKSCWNPQRTTQFHGPWTMTNQNASNTGNRWARYNNADPANVSSLQGMTGQGMWWVDGSRQTPSPNANNTTNPAFYSCCLSIGVSTYDALNEIDSLGDDVDGTYPAIPMFISNSDNGVSKTSIRGRFPDIKGGPWADNLAGGLGGATVPQTGTPTSCIVGDVFFPVTASLLPGA